MKLSMNLIVLVILFCAYSTKGQIGESNDPGTDADPSALPDEDYQNGTNVADTKRTGRISGGTTASIASNPYVATVKIASSMSPAVFAGAIISDTHVITAAKDLVNFQKSNMPLTQITIRAGSNYQDKEGFLFTVAAIDIHSGFSSNAFNYDVGVITINGSFSGKLNVQPIPVATIEIPFSSTNPTNCFILGWGKDSSGFMVSMLSQATIKLASENTCKAAPSDIFPVALQCAESVSGSFCADKGSPVVCNNQLYGIYPTDFTCTTISKFGKLTDGSINGFIKVFVPASTAASTASQPTPRKNYLTCPCTTC